MNPNQKLPKTKVTLTTAPSSISLSAITYKICLKINLYHFISGLRFVFDIEVQEILRNNNSINKFYMRDDLTLKAIGKVLFDLQWLGRAEQRIFGAPFIQNQLQLVIFLANWLNWWFLQNQLQLMIILTNWLKVQKPTCPDELAGMLRKDFVYLSFSPPPKWSFV